ncbi:MAG: hypothetical protein WBS24_17165 [Terriglobales bacterium]
MPSYSAERCHHIKTNGTRCGSPALRTQRLCYFHHHNPPACVEVYENELNRSGELSLPVIEDPSSILVVVQRITELLLKRMIEPRTAGLLLYGLQIAATSIASMEARDLDLKNVIIDPETAETAGEADEAARQAAIAEANTPLTLASLTDDQREALIKAVDAWVFSRPSPPQSVEHSAQPVSNVV